MDRRSRSACAQYRQALTDPKPSRDLGSDALLQTEERKGGN